MIKKFVYLFLFLSFTVNGQQTINKLITKELTVQDKVEVTSTTKSSKPCPVMTEVQRDAISSPATGSCVYNSDSLQLNVYDGSTWQEAGGGGISLWATGLSYDVNDVVIESDRIYRCLIAHTSGTFSTDLASGNWTEVSGSIPVSLQDVYEDSNQPQITTNTSGLGVQFKRGSLNDTDVVVEVLNGAGTSKFSVTGEGAVSAGSTITATGNITGANLAGTNTGNSTVDAASGYIGGAGMQVVEVPNAQVTSIDLANKKVRFEFGNNNELINANMEAQTVAEGWTISNATSSSSTTRIEGSKSLSLALTGALSLSQSSTINAAQKSGVQMVASIWVNSSDVSDLQLCSLKNGSEDKCTVTGGYVQGSGWRQLTVSFLGDSTSNGLKLKSTDTTGTVLVDQAFVGIGSPIVDFTPDMDYSAQVSSSGVVSGENTDWINGNCSVSGNRISCNYISGLVTVPMNCVATPMTAGIANDTILGYSTGNTSSGFAFDGGTGARQFSVICQKQGADYKTSKAYVASSSDFGYTNAGAITITATTTNPTKGTTSIDRVMYSRDGQNIKARYQYVQSNATGAAAGSGDYLFALPAGLSFDTNVITPYSGALFSSSSASIRAYVGSGVMGSGNYQVMVHLYAYDSTRFRAITFQAVSNGGAVNSFIVSSAAFPLTDATVSYGFDVNAPISGWTDSGVIVGSFEGIEKCANAYECTSEFTAYISTTGVVTNENIDWINGNCTNPTATQRSCTYNTNLKDGVNPLSSPMNCTASAKTGTGYTSSAFVVAPTSTGFIFNSGYGTAGELQDIIVHCQKGINDYKPKTAKVASSIGVPTVPGVTTKAIDTFSTAYGGATINTVCPTSSSCTLYNQIGNGFTSITQSTAGAFTVNFSKTYSSVNCTATTVGASTVAPPVNSGSTPPMSCSNCSSLTFVTGNPASAYVATYGTVNCQGSY